MSQSLTPVIKNQLLSSACQAAKLGRQVLLDYFGHLSKVSEKHLAGLVSEADVASEKVIKDYLAQRHPKIGFLGEEEAFENPNLSLSSHESLWVVDPLDGTTNYVHRFPIFCISIGLIINGKIEVGVIDVPMLNKTYMATAGGGAFANEVPLKASQRSQVSQSLLATGFFAQNKPALKQQLKIFSEFIGQARGVRRAGAAAYDLCMVAEGVFDGFWERNLSPWDTCAGTLLVREAGGIVTNYEGGEYHPDQNSILASNKPLHGQLLKVTSLY